MIVFIFKLFLSVQCVSVYVCVQMQNMHFARNRNWIPNYYPDWNLFWNRKRRRILSFVSICLVDSRWKLKKKINKYNFTFIIRTMNLFLFSLIFGIFQILQFWCVGSSTGTRFWTCTMNNKNKNYSKIFRDLKPKRLIRSLWF